MKMKNDQLLQAAKEQIKSRKYRKWYYTVFISLAAVVIFCTVYALILPAITLEKNQAVLDCPLSVHQHTAECRDENGTLICGQADFVIHTHNESCYNAENELVCKLPEITAHEHTDDCYQAEETLICKGTEAPHTHSESCYNAENELVCELPEIAEHEHNDDCYQTEKTLICKETAVLHTHDETCRDENGKLICGMLQVTEHVHDDACFQPAEQEASGFQSDVMLTADTNETWGYNSDGIWWTDQSGQRQTANQLSSASAPSTVLNLFDYWIAEERYASDYCGGITRPDELLYGGINNGHAFKFSDGGGIIADTGNESKLNEWVGGGKNPLQGIVENRLSSNGYPVLSGKYPVDGYGYDSQESLEYLFNPAVEHEGKASYRNVRGLFGIDGDGYYSFDCKKQMAEFDEASSSFRIYNRPCDSKGFFPFNQAPQIMTAARDGRDVNHYFGITITTRFIQLNGGHVSTDRRVDTVFEFTGDDDVWIFVDDVLVGDVGGIHDSSTVKINFATGEVSVYVDANPNGAITTTLYKCYEAAGQRDTVHWQDTESGGKTFADDSTHTLKFFYLERGNYDSNLKLKYNLTEIPVSGISKVDQYGDAVPGATFTAYAADAEYHMLSNTAENGGTRVDITGEYGKDWSYDENGNIVNSSGTILVHALYTGTTGVDGMMVFTTPEGKLYSIEGLENLLGQHFILREIKRPEGYRIVYTDAHLQIWSGENQKIIKCDNTSQSGVRASSSLQITATPQLHLRREYNNSTTVDFHQDGNKPANGTLFAVVFMYTGEMDENGNITDTSDSSWTPVYGNDRTGYHLVPSTGFSEGPTAGLVAALEAVKKAAEMNGINDVVFQLSSNGTMQLTMRNLPGHITNYYRLLSEDAKSKARYTVAYYWTDQSSLDQATPENTYRVYTFAEATGDGVSYSAFERKFGATIQVPNLVNRVFVQKVNEKNEPVNGATFAIYRVHQDETTDVISYLAKSGAYVSLTENALVGSDGVITDGENRIDPLDTDVTRSYSDGIHIGTSEFTNLSDGQYIIKEVNPPPGYRINTTDVMVLVTEDTIYANAGTEDDGVIVGRGPGYLVTPLDQFASLGQIDNTLTWIYARMRITKPSVSFYDIGKEELITGYLKKNNSSEVTVNPEEAFKTYLIYSNGQTGTAFNYIPDEERNKGTDSDGYRRLELLRDSSGLHVRLGKGEAKRRGLRGLVRTEPYEFILPLHLYPDYG